MTTTTLNNILRPVLSSRGFGNEMGHLFYFFVAFLHETCGQKIARTARNQMLNDILKVKVLHDE